MFNVSRSRAVLFFASLAPLFLTQDTARRPRSPEELQTGWLAHQEEFDYLLGDWEFTARRGSPPEGGEFRGTWSAVRLDGGEILDEYRVVGDDGHVYYASTTLRSYNAADERWELVSSEPGSGLQNFGTGRRVGDEMHIEQKFGVVGPTPSTWRIRYHDIRTDGFSWRADRSLDGGQTWTKDYMEIRTRRVGPPRTLPPLAVREPAGR